MIITSYIPGRVRLRAKIFTDGEIYSRAEQIFKSSFGSSIKNYEYNPVNGSILIEYDASTIPLEKLMGHTDFFRKLNYQAEHFSSRNREIIFCMLNDLEKLLKEL